MDGTQGVDVCCLARGVTGDGCTLGVVVVVVKVGEHVGMGIVLLRVGTRKAFSWLPFAVG